MPTPLVYGQVQLSAMNWPLYVAQERGFFAAAGTYDLYLNRPTPPSMAVQERGVTTLLELLVEGGKLAPPLTPAEKYIDGRYTHRLEGA